MSTLSQSPAVAYGSSAATYGTFTVAWPALVMVIAPPQVHINWHVLFRAGFFEISTVGDPGIQGAAVTGIQGCGVSTPAAAVVAAATCGFDGALHIPNGMMFAPGMWSMIVAAGMLRRLTIATGKTDIVLGATPNEH